MENKTVNVRPFFVKCAIIEAVTVALILATVLAVVFLSGNMKRDFKKWYEKNVLADTSVSEVVSGRDSYEI